MLLQEHREVRDPLILAYTDKLARAKRHPHTMRGHRTTARRFEEYLTDLGKDAASVTPWEVEEFFEGMSDQAPGTRRTHLRRMRAWYAYAQRRGAITLDPTREVELPREADKEPVIIENDMLRRYRAECVTDQQWAQFHLLAYTGLRRQECIQLQWHDLDFRTGTLTVVKGKGGKLRHVPIHPQLAEALHELKGERAGAVIRPKRAARWIGGDTWEQILRGYTGGQNTAHDFRRTVASSLALNGVPDPLIDKILGWAPAAVGRRYYIKVAPAELQRAILRLYADDPIA